MDRKSGTYHCHKCTTRTTPTTAIETRTIPRATSQVVALTVAHERRCSEYDRSDYHYSQSIEARLFARDDATSPYDGTRFTDRRQSQIEHVVALSEAHDSGACAWTDARRAAFASDPLNLVLATPELNRSKGGKDLAEWQPAGRPCWFIRRVVAVKLKYNLTIDPTENRVIEQHAARCNLEGATDAGEPG